MKEFKIKSPEDIPEIDDTALQISEWFFCLVKTLGGQNKNCLTAYDFKKSKWIFGRAGFTTLIEYYLPS